MRIFGFEITRAKAPSNLSSPDGRNGWWPLIREPYTGAWQRGDSVSIETGLSNPTVFRCISLIASDLAKMRLRLVEQDKAGIWQEAASPSFSPVLKKPNRFQNRIQFIETWAQSKLTRGNTYVLKGRDNRGVVTSLHVLDPNRVKPLVAPDGSVYYQLSTDNLAGLEQDITVPASEIIHDRWNTLFHPLVGLSPIFACGMAALQSQEIQRNATKFFRNASRPGGVLTAPGFINQETADRLKAHWDDNYTGENAGRTAVLGDGLKYEQMGLSPHDALLVEQLKWTAETICSVFGVPAYMVGVGPAPLNNNVEALGQQYYSQCLQIHIESMELCLDEGLALPSNYGTEFDLDDLLRMDTATMVKAESDAVGAGIKAPNEARKRMNLKPVKGGEAPYLQQQNYSLEALAKRDSQNPLAAKPSPPADPTTPPQPAEGDAVPKSAEPLVIEAEMRAEMRKLRLAA